MRCKRKHMKQKLIVLSAILPFFFFSCKDNDSSAKESVSSDTLTAAQHRLPANALKGLVTSGGLETNVMATEPFFRNPTNIDVDDLGRVWVTEAYNYRPNINGNPTNALGDRIMILVDNNGDGKANDIRIDVRVIQILRQGHRNALLQKGCHHHEDDQQHEHDVDHRRDVDF